MKKDLFNLRLRSRWLLVSLLALLAGASPAWADAISLPYSYGFEDYSLETDGWTKYFGTELTSNNDQCGIVGAAKKTGSYGFRFSSYITKGDNAQYLISPELNALKGVIVNFAYKVNYGSYPESFKVGYSTTNTDVSSFTWDEGITTNNTSWQTYENTFPAGTKYVAIYYYSNYKGHLFVDDFSFTTPLSGPALAVVDGSTTISSGYTYNFGLATPGTTHYFLLSNPGTEDLGVTVSETGDFGATLSTTTIPAGNTANVALTVTMPTTTGNSVITITPASGSGIDPFVINVSGTIRDANKVYESGFTALPNGWTTSGSWYYSTANGAYTTVWYLSNNARLITPKLTITEGETFFVEAKGYSTSNTSYQHLQMQYSADGTTWTNFDSEPTLNPSNWQIFSFTGAPVGQYYIAINASQADVRMFYGGELYIPDGANFAINTDGTTQSLGVAAIDGVAEKTFTITNSGNAALPVTFTDDTDFYVAKTVTFTKPDSWTGDKLYLYAWGSEGSLTGKWPGIELTEAAQNDMSQWVYTTRLPKGAIGIKYSDNASHETSDISTSEFNDVIGLWLDDSEVKTWKNDDFSVPAKDGSTNGSASFTVRMATSTAGVKNGNIGLAFEALNATSFTIPVSGVVMPTDADVVDFNSTIPSTWVNQDNGWSIYNNEAAKCTGKKNLTTQKLDFSSDENPFFVMMVKASDSGSGDYVTVEGSADNGATWTAFDKITYSYNNGDFGANTGDYATIVVNIPNTVNKLRFNGYYVLIDQIVGLKYSNNDPKMGIYTDAECNTAVANASVTEAKGFVTEAPAAITYYIKNDGTGTMNLEVTDNVTGMTAVLGATTLTSGQSTSLTITKDETKGFFGGEAVVTAEGLGTFTINVTGVLPEDGKLNLDFSTSDDIPATWTANSWAKTKDYYTQAVNPYIETTSASSLETSTLTATAGEKVVVVAKNKYTGNTYAFGVKYKKVDAEEWSDLIASENQGTDFKMLVGTIAETGDYQLQFNGYYAQIQRIYGLSKPDAPEMVVYDGEAIAAATHSFGKVTDLEDATWTLTVKNEGLATLTGLAVALTGDNTDHYTVAIADNKTELASQETATITVTQLKDNLGSHSATLTISAADLESKVIALSGETVDHTLLNVDFEGSDWPTQVLQHGSSWELYYGYARHTSSSVASSLVLTPLTVAKADDELTFKVGRYNSSRDLTVRYTTNGGITWNDYNFGTTEVPETSLKESITSTSSYNDITITGIPAGTVAFDFYGKCIKLDDITGDYKVTSAPLMAFTTVSDKISNQNLKADGIATYTLANNGNADYIGTVSATNVTVEATGEGVTFENNLLTVPAGKSATITVTMAFTAPYGEKTGNLSITSESWVGDITKEYTATLVDPTNFVEDFSDGKPAGWYAETAGSTYNGWVISKSNGDARVGAGANKIIITEKLGVEEGKNTLHFDAKVYSGSDKQTLNVYTSNDRKNWSDAQIFTLTSDVQPFEITLTADSYVKFEAKNAVIDNLTGVKKLALPAHDLYLVSAELPTDEVTPGSTCTAILNVASLIVNETVAAELYFGDNKVGELTEQEVTTTANKSLSVPGTVPAAGTYDVYVKVYNADASVETEHVSVTVADTRKLYISAFPNATAVQADDNNEFTATFNVTVQNTGTASLDANDVSVSLIDNADATNVFTATWTAANSNVLYMNTKKDATDIATDCTLKAWCWNTTEDGIWAEFTNINDGFWSLDLDGRTNFIICRYNTAGTNENPWDNVWNKSGDLSLTNGNLVKFTGYNGDDLNFTSDNMAYLEPTMTTTLKVTVTGTLTDGENANFSFKAKENVSNTLYGSGLTSSLTITAAPVIELDETDGTVASTGSNRKVTLNHSFVKGWNTICLPFAIEATDIHVDAKALEFTKFENNALTFSPVTELEANKPYVIYVPEVITTPFEFTGKTVTTSEELGTTDNGVTFQGTYAPKAAGSLTDCFGLTAAGKIGKAKDTTTMKGFRAYFTGVDISTARVVFDDDVVTAIMALDNVQGTTNNEVYNLQGQKVNKVSKKGLYIINGKKQVIK